MMSGRFLTKRMPANQPAPGIRDIYPTSTGGNTHRRKLGPPPKNAEDGYPREIGCFQCGYPIADYTAVETCPLCGGNNFLGKRLSPLSR